MTFLMQLKFLPIKMNARIKKKLITLPLIFFSIFSINHCYAVAVGEYYHGGTVFCVSKTADITQCMPAGSGDFGLIMANEDLANLDSPNKGVHWSSAYSTTGATSPDNGATNTATIIAAFPQDNSSNNAAWLCHDYKKEVPKEGFSEWYLPSKNELNKMYLYAKANNLIGKGCSGSKPGGAQCLVGGCNSDMWYWSSSEDSDSYGAWDQNFSNGYQRYDRKVYNYFGVRAVRAFNNSTIKPFNNLLLNPNPVQIVQKIAKNDPEEKDLELGGNCLFEAVAQALGNKVDHIQLRQNAVKYIESDDQLRNTIETGIGIEGLIGFYNNNPIDVKEYLKAMGESGTYGTHIELVALARLYNLTIDVSIDNQLPVTLGMPLVGRASEHDIVLNYNSITRHYTLNTGTS